MTKRILLFIITVLTLLFYGCKQLDHKDSSGKYEHKLNDKTITLKYMQHTSLRLAQKKVELGENLNELIPCFNGESTLLALAVHDKYFDSVKFLVEHGADVNLKGAGGATPLYCALRNGDAEMAKYLLAHGAKIAIPEDILVAGYSGNIDLIKFFLEKNYDIHVKSDNKNLLLTSTYSGNIDLVKFIIEEQGFGEVINNKDIYSTPLYAACSQKGSLELFEYLLSKGAEFDSKSKNALILIDSATQSNKPQIVSRLFELGVPINDVSLGNTPLHWAVANGYTETTKILLALGANKDIKNHMGLNVIDFAKKFKNNEHTIKIVLSYQK